MPTSDGELLPKSIKVREEHHKWLQENEWFNLSGAVRDMLDDKLDQ